MLDRLPAPREIRARFNIDPVHGNSLTLAFEYPKAGDACFTSAGGEWSDIFTIPGGPAGNYEIYANWGTTALYEIHRTRMVIDKPKLEVRPRYGTAGTEIRITNRLVASRPSRVRIGGVDAQFRVLGAHQVIATVPVLGTRGPVDVQSDFTARSAFV